MPDKRLYLLDAMALVYRAYYSLMRSPRITSKGKNTNAQFGFTNTLYDLIQKQQPSHIAVVWDTHAPTTRHDDFENYKGNRQAAPEDLLAAIPDIKEIIRGFNIPCIEKDGYEADDIIGTLALEAAGKGYEVYMVTPDKDYGQVVRDNIFIFKPATKGGTFELMGPKEVCAKWDIDRVEQVIDMLGLMGDAVDNIPGIPGIGEKTAARLLKQYDSLENILEHAGELKGSLGEKVRAGRNKAILSKKLATIITNVPVAFNEADFLLSGWNREILEAIFAELEFKTLSKRVLGVAGAEKSVPRQGNLFPVESDEPAPASKPAQKDLFAAISDLKTIADTPHAYHLVNTPENFADFIQHARMHTEMAFDTETTSVDPRTASLVGMSFSWKNGEAWYIPCSSNRDEVLSLLAQLKPLFDNPEIKWIGQNIKYDLIILKNYGIELAGPYFDTMLAHYALNPGGKQGMDYLSSVYLQYQPVSIETLIGAKGKTQGNMRDVPVEDVKEYAAEDADITFQLKQVFEPKIREAKAEDLFYEVENPLARVLADMEFEGVGLDVPFLDQYGQALGKDMAAVENTVYGLAGVSFNLASPKQLGEVLFERLQLDEKAKKTKTGQYATGEAVLNKLAHKHPIVENILTYRELSKLKSTYVDALPKLIHPETCRLHTSFNQVVVSSGRLSSNNPNLQNIPIRTERGREIRKAFIARNDDHVLVSADYSQIELRIVAALSGDEHMIEAFRAQKDIHRATAAKVYGVREEEVTAEMRRSAKAVNFGIIYGQSAFGLSENLGISRIEARNIIESYFKEYHAIKILMEQSVAFAQQHGYVQTMKGRRVQIADINSANATVRGFAERVAINAPIQGSAADMIKLAMIRIYDELQARKLKAKMILQVHDELVFDVPLEELESVKELVHDTMVLALPLPGDVPVEVSVGHGINWLDAH
ncbi:MAG TPA: DNA polymerase I [Edaphocola sp.]|nr:DNA polymerase I [Edaphocola sp.]